MSACDPLIQAERRFNATLSGSKQVGLFPCRGPVVPCRTLPPVSATRDGTVKSAFTPYDERLSLRTKALARQGSIDFSLCPGNPHQRNRPAQTEVFTTSSGTD